MISLAHPPNTSCLFFKHTGKILKDLSTLTSSYHESKYHMNLLDMNITYPCFDKFPWHNSQFQLRQVTAAASSWAFQTSPGRSPRQQWGRPGRWCPLWVSKGGKWMNWFFHISDAKYDRWTWLYIVYLYTKHQIIEYINISNMYILNEMRTT